MTTNLVPSEHDDGTKFPEPRPFQLQAHEALRQGFRQGHKNQLIMAPTGAGKCLGKDTPVLMYDGTIKMVQDIVQGDILMGPDSKPRNVFSVANGRSQLYRIVPKKGDPYVVNDAHILSLKITAGATKWDCSKSDKYKAGKIHNINVVDFINESKTFKHCAKGWRVGVVFGSNEDKNLPLPPYFLGVWLGDGNSRLPAVTTEDEEIKQYLRNVAQSFGLNYWEQVQKNNNSINAFLTNEKKGLKNPIKDALRDVGVLQNKHIPLCYLTASRKQRLELLAGFIDTDGSISKSGFDFVQKNERLAKDFVYLARSLGFAAYIKKCTKVCTNNGVSGEYWRVSINGNCDQVPNLLARKKSPPRKQIKDVLMTGISVEDAGIGEYFGFEIDGDHLFLLGDFTVTHNTYLGLRICNEAIQKGKRAVFLCDRTTLINQTSAVADRYGMTQHGVIQAKHWRRRPEDLLQIASVQTIAKREFWPQMDVLVVDEAHTTYKAWTEFANETNATVIGLSATPFTQGLGKIFTNLVNATTMHDLTQTGVLVPMRIFSCSKPDMEGAETRGGEWTDKAAEERELKIVGDVVSDWKKFGDNRKTIVFGATIKHCEELCRSFISSGIMAAVFTSETDDKERENLLKEYRKPNSHLKVLISVEALAKGFDVPDVGCICDARPLRKSLSTAIQMWGRGLRVSPETGKQDCHLLDFSGNIIRFFEDFNEIYFNGLGALDDGDKLDKKIRTKEEFDHKGCPRCSYKPFHKRCMACGYEKISKEISTALPGHMKEIFIGTGANKKKLADNAEHLWNQVCTYARFHSRPEFQSGRAWHLFKQITGQESQWAFSKAPTVEITNNVVNKIRNLNIAYKKRTSR